jgi:hypothetical protein
VRKIYFSIRNILEIGIKCLYISKKIILGRSPSVLGFSVLKVKSRNPDTFNRKIQYKMAHDRREILTMVADKLAVRAYVSERIGEQYLTKIYGVYHHHSEINTKVLPSSFVLKPNHASGAALIVADFVPESKKIGYISTQFFSKYYVNCKNLRRSQITLLAKFWLKSNYFNYPKSGFPEWAYRDITPVVYAEELLTEDYQPPKDYRFLIFNGSCSFIMVDTPGYSGVSRDFYTPDWERLDVKLKWESSGYNHDRPTNFNLMLDLAESLGAEFDHARIDFYNIDGRIIFGEITNYHAGGSQKFVPPEFDKILGSEWRPQTIY